MANLIRLSHRALLIVRGPDSSALLQGLITNDMRTLDVSRSISAFLLNTKGRIVGDLILSKRKDEVLVECGSSSRAELKNTLEKYRMRKKAEIVESDEPVCYSSESGDLPDPRTSEMGFRHYGKEGNDGIDTYTRTRYTAGVAESEETAGLLPFQANGDYLNYVSLDKGCYVGQELTARTAHTGVIRRRILPFRCEPSVSTLDGNVVDKDDKKIGQVISYSNGLGLAQLSLSSCGGPLRAQDVTITPFRPSWLPEAILLGKATYMSSKHLRRLLEEQERAKAVEAPEEEDDDQSEDEGVAKPVNRFAFIEDDSSPEVESDKEASEGDEPAVSAPVPSKSKKRNKKKNKKTAEQKSLAEMDDHEALAMLILENENKKYSDPCSLDEADEIHVEQIFKVDPRLFDPSAELKRVLGRTFKENAPQSNQRQWKGAGRIVKQQQNWPPIRNIGLTMSIDESAEKDHDVKWFRFDHNAYYEKLERMCWLAEDAMDVGIADEILHDNHYHLNSLMMLANLLRMQEDVTQAGHCIERGIFYCEQSFHAVFQPTSWNHRIDYKYYENRAFYLLLHRHMLNCIYKRCFETALNVAKLIFTMDPKRDPLAILLLIDSIAIRARQYKWLRRMYTTAERWKNLAMLPNMRYSLALAQFLDSKTDEERADADKLLIEAIVAFPSMVTRLLEELQIQADPLVETNSFMSTFAYNKEPEGLRKIMQIYSKQTSELWKAPDTLAWLERVTRLTVQDKKRQGQMTEARTRRSRVFVGVPDSVVRLAILLGLESSQHGVTDPAPPTYGMARYTRNDQEHAGAADEGLLAGFLHSMYPGYNPTESLRDAVRRLYQEAFGDTPLPGPEN